MDKKTRDRMLPKRFSSTDVAKWQEAANSLSGGNLTLWMENVLNEAAKKQVGNSKVKRQYVDGQVMAWG